MIGYINILLYIHIGSMHHDRNLYIHTSVYTFEVKKMENGKMVEEEMKDERIQKLTQKVWDENPWKTWSEAKGDAKQIVGSWM